MQKTTYKKVRELVKELIKNKYVAVELDGIPYNLTNKDIYSPFINQINNMNDDKRNKIFHLLENKCITRQTTTNKRLKNFSKFARFASQAYSNSTEINSIDMLKPFKV